MNWLLSLAAAATLVVAWWIPGSVECAALGWTSTALFVASFLASGRRMLRSFVAGLVTYTGGFYWLYGTIRDFGGFSTVAALLIFALFVVGSTVQFLIWSFTWSRLPAWAARYGLRSALAWLVAHHFWIKIFPWDFGHTQIGFVPLAQIADIGGVTAITFMMMWVAECFIARRSVGFSARLAAAVALVAAIGYGVHAEQRFGSPSGPRLKTAMVQGNVSLQRKHDIAFFTVNQEQYLKTSAKVAEKDLLIVWPESTITKFIPTTTTAAYHAVDRETGEPLLPFLNNGSAFLVGGLTYRSRSEFFNSSILIRPDGSLDTPYNKMILMPFGEYTPLSYWLPWLEEINSTAAQFTAGQEPSILSFALSNGMPVKLSPLICYEDVVPEIAREATQRGAQLLINQTNDAWFGQTAAPYQHHTIASFRAIENRRYLLRSTNTGLTAVVDPLGRTAASLLPFSTGVLPMEIELLSDQTVYTSAPVDALWLILATMCVLLVVLPRRARQ